MKKHQSVLSICLLASAMSAGLLGAAENYQTSLKAGDEKRAENNPDAAIAEYDAAAGQADSDTERSLANGKKGYVLAYDKKDYPGAREQAQKALAQPSAGSVAQVTALQVLAECQLKSDKNYVLAAETLEMASKLEGVDWAQPIVALMLGDSFRFSGQFDKGMASYQRILDMPKADADVKALANLSQGLIWQYDKSEFEKANASYAAAVALKPALKSEVDAHLAKIPAAPSPAKPNP